ncbi:hypothetical protein NF27_DP01390 [Candidatus Jidaibacter acanthamoeba]|uniref:Transcription antitermination protein NusB n=1 Tax=Candidatus Jidaibacter acanthamoebae TaxID=86105 RepID=A0A0C1QZY2_9RICK|nr:hypothetical protein NF27_DP01390 [Candidatus Jidaibacter acanthamoeba]
MTQAVDTKTKFYSSKIRAKRNSRILAIQCIYAYETWLHHLDSIDINQLIIDVASINNFDLLNSTKKDPIDKKYLINMIKGAIASLKELDHNASLYLAHDWKVERLPKLVKNVIRLGIYELINTKDLDKLIIINEYLDIAKLFNHEGEVGFINTVLDKVSKENL